MTDLYKTILAPSSGIYKEKGSKFLAFAYSVNSEEAIKDRLGILKKEYHDARHLCFAWVLGAEKLRYRINDDSEPPGSAGKPIFGQIQSRNLTDILVVVVRYFGGTLLGVGGLINAYRSAASEALEHSQIIERRVYNQVKVEFEYEQINAIMKVIKDYELDFKDQKFDLKCSLTIEVWKRKTDQVLDHLSRIPDCNLLVEE